MGIGLGIVLWLNLIKMIEELTTEEGLTTGWTAPAIADRVTQLSNDIAEAWHWHELRPLAPASIMEVTHPEEIDSVSTPTLDYLMASAYERIMELMRTFMETVPYSHFAETQVRRRVLTNITNYVENPPDLDTINYTHIATSDYRSDEPDQDEPTEEQFKEYERQQDEVALMRAAWQPTRQRIRQYISDIGDALELALQRWRLPDTTAGKILWKGEHQDLAYLFKMLAKNDWILKKLQGEFSMVELATIVASHFAFELPSGEVKAIKPENFARMMSRAEPRMPWTIPKRL